MVSDASLNAIEELRRMRGELARLYLGLGDREREQGHSDRAATCYRRAAVISGVTGSSAQACVGGEDPGAPGYWAEIARARIASGRTNEATRLLLHSISIAPTAVAFERLALVHDLEGRAGAARAARRRAGELAGRGATAPLPNAIPTGPQSRPTTIIERPTVYAVEPLPDERLTEQLDLVAAVTLVTTPLASPAVTSREACSVAA